MSARSQGQRNYHSGLAAEDIVQRRYIENGYELARRRWRGRSGEIDLIFRKGADIVFAEVKASRDFARAAQSFSRRQLSRIVSAADEFLAADAGHCNVSCRIDLALVDGQGRSHVLENVSVA